MSKCKYPGCDNEAEPNKELCFYCRYIHAITGVIFRGNNDKEAVK